MHDTCTLIFILTVFYSMSLVKIIYYFYIFEIKHREFSRLISDLLKQYLKNKAAVVI